MKETGAGAVKIEGGSEIKDSIVRILILLVIPVMWAFRIDTPI
jgi:ketopantoate hydroxymethyltransferase